LSGVLVRRGVRKILRFIQASFRSIAAGLLLFSLLFVFKGTQEGCAVWLDKKVTKRSSQQNPSTHRQNAQARVCWLAFARLSFRLYRNSFLPLKLSCYPPVEQLRAKAGKTMVAGAVAGHSMFLLKQVAERAKAGQNKCSPSFA